MPIIERRPPEKNGQSPMYCTLSSCIVFAVSIPQFSNASCAAVAVRCCTLLRAVEERLLESGRPSGLLDPVTVLAQ